MLAALLRQARRILLTVLLGGLLGATLVRLGPGFGVDERELDSRLSAESQQAIRAERAATTTSRVLFPLSGGAWCTAIWDFRDRSIARCRAAQRTPAADPGIARPTAYWAAFPSASLALLTVWWRAPGADIVPAVTQRIVPGRAGGGDRAGFLWMAPWIGAASRWAIALVVFPHVYRYAKNQLVATSQSPHVVAAQAKGLSSWRVLVGARFHSRGAATGGLGGNLGESGVRRVHPHRSDLRHPGVGQLAWRAALDRDLPLLVTITVLVALMTLVVNSLADLALAAWKPRKARRAA
jgi:peptide/nickel transport system permease protein